MHLKVLGQIDGLVFSGISMSSVIKQISLTVVLSCLIGIALIIIGILIVEAYIKRTVSDPLFHLTILAQTLEQGNLGLNQHETMMSNSSTAPFCSIEPWLSA